MGEIDLCLGKRRTRLAPLRIPAGMKEERKFGRLFRLGALLGLLSDLPLTTRQRLRIVVLATPPVRRPLQAARIFSHR